LFDNHKVKPFIPNNFLTSVWIIYNFYESLKFVKIVVLLIYKNDKLQILKCYTRFLKHYCYWNKKKSTIIPHIFFISIWSLNFDEIRYSHIRHKITISHQSNFLWAHSLYSKSFFIDLHYYSSLNLSLTQYKYNID